MLVCVYDVWFILLFAVPQLNHQVMKFGNESQINLIAAEIGGAVGAAPLEAQIELFNALIDGCTEAVELGSLDPKVYITLRSLSQSMCGIDFIFVFSLFA